MMGVFPARIALEKAQDAGMDLVEIAPQSKPPTCKIMDYGKWKFEAKKKEKESRKSQVKVITKEIQVRPSTGERDVDIKLQKAREFLNNGWKVKANLRFSGREIAHKELGFKLLKQIEEKLSDISIVETPATLERRTLFTILSPKPQKNN